MSSSDRSTEPPAAWLESLARADHDVAHGRIVDGAAIHARLRASIARMEQAAAVVPVDPE